MNTLSLTNPSPPGVDRSRSKGDPTARRGRKQETAILLLGDAVAGQASPAPSDTQRTAPRLVGDPVTERGSPVPAKRRQPRPASRRARVPLLEEALAEHVASLGRNRLEHRRLQAVIDRLGLGGRPPVTLAEAGRVAGLSGERVRQLEARLRERQAKAPSPPPLPQLDAALAAVVRALPLPAAGVGRLLLESGIAAGDFSAESLGCAAELLRRDLPFVVSGTGRAMVLLPRVAAAAVAHETTIESRARRQVERGGATTIQELERELAEDDGVTVSRRQLRVVLEANRAVVCHRHGWLSFSDARSAGAFVRASIRMLAVAPSLSVESMRDGLRRHNAFRRLPEPPPVVVLTEVYGNHPAFRVEGDLVSAAQPLDVSAVGPLNRRMVEILRAAHGGVLARRELLASCHQAGLNLTSVNLYTTYSECIERVGPGLFAARGTTVAPHLRTSVKRRPVPRAGDRPVHGWTPDGQPWLTARVTPSTWANGVVHVPAALRPVLEGRHFPCHDSGGDQVTTIGVDRHGNSWGWTGFLRRSGAQLGDVVRAVFDTAAGTAVVELAEDDADPTTA